jgi:hypothetical protein
MSGIPTDNSIQLNQPTFTSGTPDFANVNEWSKIGNNIYNTSLGNIGIGTTNPNGYKLNISGSLNSTSLHQNGTLIDFSSYATNTALTNGLATKQNTLTASTTLLGNGSSITDIDWNKITLNKPSLYTQSEITSLLSSKENNLTFSTPLTRTTNTIGINLNAYVPFNALASCNYITNSTTGLNNYPSYTALNNSNYVPFTALTQSNYANYTQLNNCNYVRHTSLTNSNYVPFTALASCNYIINSTNGLTNYPNYITLNSCNFVPFNALNNSNYANYTQLNNCNYVPFTALASCNYIINSVNNLTNYSTTPILSNIFPTSNVLSNTSNILNTAINTKENILTFSSPIIRNINTISLNQSLISYNNITDRPDLNLYLLKSGGTMTGQITGITTLNGTTGIFGTIATTNNTNQAIPSLGVAGGVGDKYIIQSGTISTYPYSIGFETNSLWISSPNTIKLYNNGVNSILINSSGNVGIKNSSPYLTLDVGSTNANHNIGRSIINGTIHDANKRDALSIGRWDGTEPYINFTGLKYHVTTGADGGNTGFDNQSHISFWTWGNSIANSREVMRLTSRGRLGIGTTEPQALLHITGKAIFHNGLLGTPVNGLYGNDGTRLILWPGAVDNPAYSLGINNGTMWYCVPGGAIHSFYVATSEKMRINASGYVGINTNDPKCHLQVNGIANINNGSPSVVANGYMAPGSLTIGGTSSNYGGGTNLWNTNTAGLLMECLDNTEIAVHDSQLRVASLMYYEGGANNRIIIGRNMGWDSIANVIVNGLLSVSATNNSYIKCGANSGGYFLNVGSTSSDSSTMYNATSGGIWTSVTGALHINPSTANSIVYINFFNTAGLLSVGGAIAQAKLHVASGTYATGLTTLRYWNVGTTNLTLGASFNDICAIFDSSIWCKSSYVAFSSDERIKTNIKDIEDDGALQKILQIQPKTYEYIDKVEKGDNNIYGFIAQQIKEVIPEAVKIQKCIIPNIYKVCNYTNNAEGSHSIITIPDGLIEKLKINDEIDIVIKNDRTKTFNILEIIDDTIKINEVLNENETECFVYGSKVDDFHTLDKNYIYTLNVCATQELYKLIQKQNEIIENLQLQINELKNNL